MIRLSKLALVAAALSSGSAFAVTNDLQANYGTITVPYSQGFSNTFTSLGGGNFLDQTGHTISDSTAVTQNIVSAPGTAVFNFYDDFLFTMPTSAAGSLTASAVSVSFGSLFGINNLQARMYEVTSGLTTSSAGSSLITAWSVPTSVGGNTITVSTFASPITLLAGSTYALEIRGDVIGATGSYGGNLNISAVPEADGWALATMGLALVGLARRRLSKQA